MIDFNENNVPEEEEDESVFYLTDEEGNESPFELMDVIPYKDDQYAVFLPIEEPEEDEDDIGVVILKVIPEDDESVSFEGTDDEEALDAVLAQFSENMRKAFDEDEHGDGCGCGHCHE